MAEVIIIILLGIIVIELFDIGNNLVDTKNTLVHIAESIDDLAE